MSQENEEIRSGFGFFDDLRKLIPSEVEEEEEEEDEIAEGNEESHENSTSAGEETSKIEKPHRSVDDWTYEDVSDWLVRMGLADYVDIFHCNQIDGQVLLTMSEADLRQPPLNFTVFGQIRKFGIALGRLKAENGRLAATAAVDANKVARIAKKSGKRRSAGRNSSKLEDLAYNLRQQRSISYTEDDVPDSETIAAAPPYKPKKKIIPSSVNLIDNNDSGTRPIHRRKAYSISTKIEAVKISKISGIRFAAKLYNVDGKSIRDWRRKETQMIEELSRGKGHRQKLRGGGRKPHHVKLESILMKKIVQMRAERKPVTWKIIQRMAKLLWEKLNFRNKEGDNINFLASNGWLHKFIQRSGLGVKNSRPEINVEASVLLNEHMQQQENPDSTGQDLNAFISAAYLDGGDDVSENNNKHCPNDDIVERERDIVDADDDQQNVERKPSTEFSVDTPGDKKKSIQQQQYVASRDQEATSYDVERKPYVENSDIGNVGTSTETCHLRNSGSYRSRDFHGARDFYESTDQSACEFYHSTVSTSQSAPSTSAAAADQSAPGPPDFDQDIVDNDIVDDDDVSLSADDIDLNDLDETVDEKTTTDSSIIKHARRKRRAYDFRTKVEAIECAKVHGNRYTARLYEVDVKLIRQWRRKEHLLRQASDHSRKKLTGAAAGRRQLNDQLESILAQNINELKNQGHWVNGLEIRRMAAELYQQQNPTNQEPPAQHQTFMASSGWLQKFIKRHDISLKHPPKE